MTFVKRNKDIILSIYNMQQFLPDTVLFQTAFCSVNLIFVDGSSHLEVFYCSWIWVPNTFFFVKEGRRHGSGAVTGLCSLLWVVDRCGFFICFPWILGMSYFRKSCHGCFLEVFLWNFIDRLCVDLL